MTPRIAWVFAHALAGCELNGEAHDLPEPYRAVAASLAAVRVDDALTGQARREALTDARDPLWEELLAKLPPAEREAWESAVDAVETWGPQPEAEPGEDADGWPPLALTAPPPAEPFPLDVLPEAAAALVREGADAIGCPPDFLALPVLAVAAGAIGRSVALMLKPRYFAPASLYAACVGPPSDGKTPALKAVAAAVRRIDRELADAHAAERERWEAESKRPGPDGKKADPGPPPRPRRIVVDDITLEAVPLVLADNPRGLVMVRDELSALLLGMNQYKAGGKGSDRPTLLKLWSGDAMIRDRVADADRMPLRCLAPCLSIVGGLPPAMLGSLSAPKGQDDGFTDRFLFVYPEPLPVAPWSERGIPDDVADAWRDLVGRLWARPMALKDDRQVPHAARFTDDGKAAWQERYDAHAAEMNAPDFPPDLRGPWGKMREHAARLALILVCMEHAADPTADPEEVPSVGPRVVVNAWRLIGYFKNHARRTHAAMAPGSETGCGAVVKAVVDWIRDGNRLTFSERDVKQARRWIKDDDLAEALGHLARRHAIRPREGEDEPRKPCRPRSPGYDVNPTLLDTQNTQNTQNYGSTPSFECFETFE